VPRKHPPLAKYVEPSPIFDPDRLVRYDEVGEVVSVAERTVRDWVDRGLLRSVKLPGGRRIRGSELNRFISERES
jgi:excisionase family DNA binding protein